MTYSAFDHPYLSGLLGDEAVAAEFSTAADIHAMLSFEAALARAEAIHGVIPESAADRITEACRGFSPDVAALRRAMAVDGVVVPELVRQLRAAVGGEAATHVHFGATSQDVIDTSLMLRMKAVAELFGTRLGDVVSVLEECDDQWGERMLMGRTRMQAAIPITVSDRLAHLDRTVARSQGSAAGDGSRPLCGPVRRCGRHARQAERQGRRCSRHAGRGTGACRLSAVAQPAFRSCRLCQRTVASLPAASANSGRTSR